MSDAALATDGSGPSFVQLPAKQAQGVCGATFIQVRPDSRRPRKRRQRQPSHDSAPPTCLFCSKVIFSCEPPRPVNCCSDGCGRLCVHEDCAQKELLDSDRSSLQLPCQHCRKAVVVRRVCVLQHLPQQLWQQARAATEGSFQRGIFWSACYFLLQLLYRLFVFCCYVWLCGLVIKAQLIWSRGVASQWHNFDLWRSTVVMDFQGEAVEETLLQVGRVHLVCAAAGWLLLQLLRYCWHKLGLKLLVRKLLYVTAIHRQPLSE